MIDVRGKHNQAREFLQNYEDRVDNEHDYLKKALVLLN